MGLSPFCTLHFGVICAERLVVQLKKITREALSASAGHAIPRATNFSSSHGEFDPGSELTLVACLSHASRARKSSSEGEYSGKRVSNAWVIYL